MCLIQENIAVLAEALDVIARLDEAAYARVGPQFRHAIEFYECLLEGCERGWVDYDARRRESAGRLGAMARVRAIMVRLPGVTGGALHVRLDGEEAESTAGRELQFLRSHTVHHHAVIALLLRAAGVEPGAEFGVAESTRRHAREAATCAR